MMRLNIAQYKVLSLIYDLRIVSADDDSALVYLGGQRK